MPTSKSHKELKESKVISEFQIAVPEIMAVLLTPPERQSLFDFHRERRWMT